MIAGRLVVQPVLNGKVRMKKKYTSTNASSHIPTVESRGEMADTPSHPVHDPIRSILGYVLTGAVALALGFFLARCMYQQSGCGCQRQPQANTFACGRSAISSNATQPQPPSSGRPRFVSAPGETSDPTLICLKSPELFKTPASALLLFHEPIRHVSQNISWTLALISQSNTAAKQLVDRYFASSPHKPPPDHIRQWMYEDVANALTKANRITPLVVTEPDLGILSELTDEQKKAIQPQLNDMTNSFQSLQAFTYLLRMAKIVVQEIASNSLVLHYITDQVTDQISGHADMLAGSAQCHSFTAFQKSVLQTNDDALGRLPEYATVLSQMVRGIARLMQMGGSPGTMHTYHHPISLLNSVLIEAPGNKAAIDAYYDALGDFIRTCAPLVSEQIFAERNIEVIIKLLHSTCNKTTQ